MPWLTTEGASLQIAEGETVVGSGEHAGWRLPRHELAARHFVVERTGSRITIRPCGVDNVIAINGSQSGSKAHDLKDGDTIDAGSARFLYSSERSGSYPSVAVSPAHLVETRDGVAHDLTRAPVGIGRDRVNAVVVRDPTASRFHAEIRREAGGYVLHPQGSSGTLLNGRRIGSPERLSDGDRIEIANSEFRFVGGPIPAEAPTAARAENDEQSRRATVQLREVTVVPELDERRPGNGLKWVLAAFFFAVILYLVIRR